MLTMIDGELHVAMFEREEEPFAGFFVLPGKRVGMSRDLRDIMFELLSEHIGDIDVIPEQFFTFSAEDRDPRGWVVSVGYLGVVRSDWLIDFVNEQFATRLVKVTLPNERNVAQFHFEGLQIYPGFDHGAITAKAIDHVRQRLDDSTFAFDLLPDEFTLLDLLQVYEALLGRTYNKQVFRKRMLARTFGDGSHLEPTGEFRTGRNRPAALFRRSWRKRGKTKS